LGHNRRAGHDGGYLHGCQAALRMPGPHGPERLNVARISTHVLDIAKGAPAAGIKVELHFDGILVASAMTNADGRTDVPILIGDEIPVGRYELVFHAGDYFAIPGIPFLDEIVIRFGVADSLGNYHVPLLMAPHGYSTYRGS